MQYYIYARDLILALNTKFENTFDENCGIRNKRKINTAMKTSSIYFRNR
jgi:hypothetical protein